MYYLMMREDFVSVHKSTKYYTWKDSNWSSFMVAMMHFLEPRKFHENEQIYMDLEDVEEIVFVQVGEVRIANIFKTI